MILPVRKEEGARRLIAAIDSLSPDAVLCVGQASRRASISIERLFINLRDYELPDDRGDCPRDEPIDPVGPAAFFSNMPVRELVDAIHGGGIDAELSWSAGTYLCDEIGYVMMSHLARCGISIPAGFIHVPMLPEQAAIGRQGTGPLPPSMALEASRRAVGTAIQCVRQHVVRGDVARATMSVPATLAT